jgi:DNA-binding beta-propeller fold protein YncE
MKSKRLGLFCFLILAGLLVACGVKTATPLPSTSLPPEFAWKIAGDPNPFFKPTGIALDPHGNIYVVDFGNSRVQKYDSNGKFLLMWGSPGSAEGSSNS